MAVATTQSGSAQGILLEAGTNEVEILVFKVAGRLCGVNVAKVREVRPHQQPTAVPHAPPGLEGVLRVREEVVPVVNLRKVLWGEDRGADVAESGETLLLEFNNQIIAFRVQDVDRIHRVSWKRFIPLPHGPGMSAPVTGVILIDNRIVTILDFESIGADFGLNGTITAAGDASAPVAAGRPPIVYADDSLLIRKMLDDALDRAGYNQRHGFNDGQETWDYLCATAQGCTAETIGAKVACVVSDVEMPQMDGFTLTRRIREHPVLANLPVVLFSSLVSKDNEKKGRQVGATAQISKPRWSDLSATLLDVIGGVVA